MQRTFSPFFRNVSFFFNHNARTFAILLRCFSSSIPLFAIKQKIDYQSKIINRPIVCFLQENADHPAVPLIDDLFQCLLHFDLGIRRHVHQLVGEPLTHQI